MKNIIISFIITVLITSCSSAPKNPNACKVWSEDARTPDTIYVENDAAFYGAGCITGRMGCKWKEATFESDSVVVNGELSETIGKVLIFKNNEYFLPPKSSFMTKFIGKALSNGEEFKVLPDRVILTSKLTGLSKAISMGKEEHSITFLHSASCTKREVALGVGYILAGTAR